MPRAALPVALGAASFLFFFYTFQFGRKPTGHG